MGGSLADAFDYAYNVSRQVKTDKDKRKNDMMDQLLRKAQIQEAGYDIQGEDVVQRPDFVSAKQAASRKLGLESDILSLKRDRMRRASLGGQVVQSAPGTSPLGSQSLGSGVPEGYKSYIDPNTGDEKVVKDLSVPTPMNEAQKFKYEQEKLKAAALAQKDTDAAEGLKSEAEATLNTIGEVRKGKKYFGPLGGLPTVAAPSTYLENEYGPRMNWETNVNKLLSKRVVDLMNEMKRVSRTGATGFGQLNRSELQLLQNASTALKRELNSNDAMKYLTEIEAMYKKVLNKGGQGTPQKSYNSPEEADASEQPGTIVMVQGKRYQV